MGEKEKKEKEEMKRRLIILICFKRDIYLHFLHQLRETRVFEEDWVCAED